MKLFLISLKTFEKNGKLLKTGNNKFFSHRWSLIKKKNFFYFLKELIEIFSWNLLMTINRFDFPTQIELYSSLKYWNLSLDQKVKIS